MSFLASFWQKDSSENSPLQGMEEPSNRIQPSPIKHTRRTFLVGTIASSSLLALGTGGYVLVATLREQALPLLTRTDLGSIDGLAWSPDGRYIAVAKSPVTREQDLSPYEVGTYGLQIWTADGSQMLMSYQTETTILSLSWAPHSQRLAIACGNVVQILLGPGAGGKTGAAPVAQFGVAMQVYAAAWSPDGASLVFSQADFTFPDQAKGVLMLWNFSANKAIWQTTQKNNVYWNLSWSPDSQRLAVSPMNKPGWMGVLDARNGRPLLELGHEQDLMRPQMGSLVWSPDGRFIAFGYTLPGDGSQGKVSVQDARLGKDVTAFSVQAFKDNGPAVEMVVWSPDSRYLAAIGNAGLISLWDLSTDALVDRYPPGPGIGDHTSPSAPLAWSPRGKQLISAVDGTSVRYWEVP